MLLLRQHFTGLTQLELKALFSQMELPYNEGETSQMIWDALRNLVPLLQFKKREKLPWRSVTGCLARNSQLEPNGPNWEFLLAQQTQACEPSPNGAGGFGACSEGPQWGTGQSAGKFLGFGPLKHKKKQFSYTEQSTFSSIILNSTVV